MIKYYEQDNETFFIQKNNETFIWKMNFILQFPPYFSIV